MNGRPKFLRSVCLWLNAGLVSFSLYNPPLTHAITAPKPVEKGVRVYLNPNTGRFWTMDSYEGDNEDTLSLHKYLYCHANSVDRVDPSGNYVEDPLIAGEKSLEIRGRYESTASQSAAKAEQKLAGALIKALAVTLPLVLLPGDDVVDDPEIDRGGYVYLFRELDGDKYGTPVRYRKPKLSPSQFRNDPVKDPDGVSTFETLGLPGEKPYLVGFLVRYNPPGPKIRNVTKGPIMGLTTVEATYTPEPPMHWSLQGVSGLSREDTKVALSTYAKAVKIVKNFRFPQFQSVDEP